VRREHDVVSRRTPQMICFGNGLFGFFISFMAIVVLLYIVSFFILKNQKSIS